MASTLFDVLGDEWFCVTAVRGLGEADVLARLGAAGSDPLPRYPIDGVAEHFGLESWAVRVYCPEGTGWAYVFDALPEMGVPFREPVLKELSRGTEAVSVWQPITASVRVAHARDGKILTLFDWGRVDPASGTEPDRLNRVLDRAGFFLDEPDDDFSGPAAALEAVESEFGLAVDPQEVAGPLPTVVVPVRGD
ncbi:DUF6461 domain-containing protein [Streptomyces sp. NEAU-W12]|uniref:DUF6461 domain-containing protein n=1 Tax=Streptomyces sp. NEAU-W12 TaxID=2994668 RepID=UPI00224B7DD2|nr:DUF6461 domain-containing protein [Streptomyces sp. NEAU-W12]MCX2928465.1 DUF6461 domain-containing protein [Streptomyces sp. NEAU-W12]